MERFIHLETVDSTNNYLKKLALEGAESGTVVYADAQTAGRGRLGRSFVSTKGDGIYLSYLFKPGKHVAEAVRLTARTAVVVSDAIEGYLRIRPQIKWVNDLLINKRKVCGILTEMSTDAENNTVVIIGVGINTNKKVADFPEELQGFVGSIKSETGRTVDNNTLLSMIIAALDRMCADYPGDEEDYISKYRKASVIEGRKVILHGSGDREATVVQINDDYSLCVRFPDGNMSKVSSGDVSIRGIYETK